MATGSIKWFNNRKGFGFIATDENNEDIFLHYSAIEMDGFKTVARNQRVTFESQPNPNGKGTQAVNVKILEEETT